MSVEGKSVSVMVRAATSDDVAGVLALWRQADTHPSATDDTASVKALIEWDHHALLIAENEGGVIGVLIAAFDGWRGNMYRLAVHPRHRRSGIARRLVDQGEQLLRERGARRISALVAHEQAGAEEFWTDVGYSPDPHTTRFVKTF